MSHEDDFFLKLWNNLHINQIKITFIFHFIAQIRFPRRRDKNDHEKKREERPDDNITIISLASAINSSRIRLVKSYTEIKIVLPRVTARSKSRHMVGPAGFPARASHNLQTADHRPPSRYRIRI